MAELAHAYVALRISTGSMASDTRKALQGIEPEAEKTGKSMGAKLSSGIGSVLKKSAIGVGVAGGAALAAGLTKGVGRLAAIEGAEAKLTGLGNSAQTVGGVMENALASVKGTAFGLEEAATVAAGMVAAGIKPGQELEAVLKTVGDTAAIAGTDMASMGDIFGKVAAKGKLQGNELFQLSQSGIPALQLLSKHLGKTSEEVTKMVSKGQIDFDTFAAAMAGGVGGAALEMGNTTSGALKNMGAAAGRLGATLAGPFFTQAGGAFRGLTDLLDDLNAKAGPVMERFGGWLEGTAVPALINTGFAAQRAFEKFRQSEFARVAMADLKGIFSSLAGTAGEVWPSLMKIGGALAEASQALGVSAWSVFVSSLQVAASVLGALTGPLELVADVMQAQPGLVTAAVAAWLAFKTVPMVMGRVTAALSPIASRCQAAGASLAGLSGAVRDSYKWMGQANPQMGRLGVAAGVLGANAGAAAKGGLSAMGRAGSSLLGVFGGPLGAALTGVTVAVVAGIGANKKLESSQKALEAASVDLGLAQSDMWSQIGDAAGVADAVVDQLSAVRAEMDAAISGDISGFGGEMAAIGKNFSWEGIAASFRGENLGQQMLDESQKIAEGGRLAKAALDELGMSNDEVAGAISGSAADWDLFAGRLRSAGDGGREALAGIQPLRDEYMQMQGMLDRVGPGFFTLRDALDVLGDSASTVDQKLNSMRSALEQMGLIQSSAEQQVANVVAAVEKLGGALDGTTLAADEFGRVFQNADGSLNLLNTNTHAFNDAAIAMQDELMGVAASGGDALGLFQDMQPELEAMRGQFEAAGYDFDGWLNKMGMTPETISTMVQIQGLDTTQADMAAITNKLREVEVGAEVPVTIRGGEEGKLALEQFGVTVDWVDDKKVEAMVSVDNETALATLLDTDWRLTEFASKPPWVSHILAENGQAQGAIGQTQDGLSLLGATHPWSNIHAENGQAQGAIGATQGGLNHLDATNPWSNIGAENGQAQGAIGATQGGLDRVGNTHPESKIRADNSQANSAISTAMGWLNNIPPATTTQVIFNAVYRGFRAITGQDNAAGGAWDGERALPRFATGGHSGYRLPTAGPGTEVTDGFIAFNRDNVPAARLDAGEWIINGRSSEKYNRELAQINAGTFPKLPGYAGGARHDAKEMLDFVNGKHSSMPFPLTGAAYDWGNQTDPYSWGDCSGTASRIAGFAVGMFDGANRALRQFATANQRDVLSRMGFQMGMGGEGDLRIGWRNGGPGGGHTATTLPDGMRAEMGGGSGGGQVGGRAAGHDDPYFNEHAFLPTFKWQFGGIEGLDGLMPPGGTNVGPIGMDPASNPGLYESPGNSVSAGGSKDQPRTWSDIAAGAVSQLVGGQVSDVLGVFGVPDQLPPIVQAWQMLNEKPGGGPSDWDLSTTAAEVKRLHAAIQVREQFTDEARKAINAMNDGGIGNALPSGVVLAESELDKQLLDLESDRVAYERAQSKLEGLLGARAAALATKDMTSGGSDVTKLSEALSQPPSVGIPDEIMRELKMAYDPAGGAEQWRPMVIEALKRNGFAATQREQDLMIAQIQSESGGNPSILQQVQDVNSGGNEAKGLLQVIPGTFAAHRDPELPDDRTDPWSNMNAALRYYKSRYGMDLGAMWGQGHGYNLGGWISGQGTKDSVPLVGAPGEFIVNRRAAAENRDQLEAMNSGRSVNPGGGGVTYHIHTFYLDEAMRELSRKEAQHAQTYLGARV